MEELHGCRRFWHAWVSAAFLDAWLEHAAPSSFLPRGGDELSILNSLLLDRGLHDLEYQLHDGGDSLQLPVTLEELLEMSY